MCKKRKKHSAKAKFTKKESCIAKEAEKKVFKVGKKSCTPATEGQIIDTMDTG